MYRLTALTSLALAAPAMAQDQISGDWNGTCVRDTMRPGRLGIHLHRSSKTLTTPAIKDSSTLSYPLYAFQFSRANRNISFRYTSSFDGTKLRFSGVFTPDFKELSGNLEAPSNDVVIACKLGRVK
jgi:hypothetical protein